MAGLKTLLPLVVCLSLGQRSLAKNEEPCQPSKWVKMPNGYETAFARFQYLHLPNKIPSDPLQNKDGWKTHINEIGGCVNRPTQSFLYQRDLEKVKAVCSSHGGKTLKENLCISKEEFTFITVVTNGKTDCMVQEIKEEKKHLILGCDVVDDKCLPVHFEGNSQNAKPADGAKDCVAPQKP